MKRYQSHKQVNAGKIVKIIYPQDLPEKADYQAVITLQTGDELKLSEAWLKKHEPEIGGYFVEYDDGYQSYSPADAFENGYTELQ